MLAKYRCYKAALSRFVSCLLDTAHKTNGLSHGSMANQYKRNKGTKRKGEHRVTQRPTKRARSHEQEHEETVELEDQPDTTASQDEDEDQQEPERSELVPTKRKAASKPSDEGGGKGQRLFEGVEKSATEGRALDRGGRNRRPPTRYPGFGDDRTFIERDDSTNEDADGKDEKTKGNGKGKGVRKPAVSGPNEDKGKRKGKGKEKAPVKWPKKQDDFDRPPSRPRDRIAGKVVRTPDNKKNPGGRRILAKRTVGKQEWYLLDWFPTWVKRARVLGDLLEVWEGNEAPHKFKWGCDTLYHLKNPTNDDSSEMMRTLLESVFQMYVEYMAAESHVHGIEALARDLFDHDDDWEIFETEDNDATLAEAMSNDDSSSDRPSAAEMLRRTFRDAWSHRLGGELESSEPEYLYGDVLITYNGWLDDQSDDNQFQPENGATVRSLIEPMFDPMLWTEDYMNASKWDAERAGGTKRSATELNEHIRELSVTLSRVVQGCPFLLKKPWPLMLVALFWWDEELRNLINAGSFRFTLLDADEENEDTNYKKWNDSWEWRSVDNIIYTYIDECDWEWRCMDEVCTTLAEAQKFITASVKAANSPPDDDDSDPAERPSRKGKDTQKQSPPNPLPPRKRGENNARTRQPQNRPSPMSGENGQGPSGTHSRRRRQSTTEQPDDDADLYVLPSPRTTAAAKDKGKRRARSPPNENDDVQPTEAPPKRRPAAAPPKSTASQPKKPTAPKPTATKAGITANPGASPAAPAAQKPQKAQADSTSESSGTSDDDVPWKTPSPGTRGERENRKQDGAKAREAAAVAKARQTTAPSTRTSAASVTATATGTSKRPGRGNRAYWARVLGTGATVVDD